MEDQTTETKEEVKEEAAASLSSADQSAQVAGDAKKRFQRRPMGMKKKICRLCSRNATMPSYKNAEALKRYTTDRGRILQRHVTGLCAKHQRLVVREIERARTLAWLPYEKRH